MTRPEAVHAPITQIFHEAHSRVLASLISTFRDFELAEDVLQDAFVSALSTGL